MVENKNDLPKDFKAVMFISSALGGLEVLRKDEPHDHTRRCRKIKKAMDVLWDLFQHYPEQKGYDYISIGSEFHERMSYELDKLIMEKTKNDEEKHLLSDSGKVQ